MSAVAEVTSAKPPRGFAINHPHFVTLESLMSVTIPISRVPITLSTSVPTPMPPIPVAALSDIAAGLAHIERIVPLRGEDTHTPRSIRLIATPDYDVWLITWPPGSELGAHDHAGATSVIRLVQGSLVEDIGSQRRVLAPHISVGTPPPTPTSQQHGRRSNQPPRLLPSSG
jgi:hypothetical protein